MNGIWNWLLGVSAGDVSPGASCRVGFVADYGDYLRLGLFVALAVLVLLVVRNYRREGAAPRRVKAVLACIRLGVVAIGFAMLFRPAMIWRNSESLFSRVVLVVDDSASMGVKDKYSSEAGEAQAGRLAKLLGRSDAQIAGATRQELMRDVLLRGDGPLVRLARDHHIEVVRFAPPPSASGGAQEYVQSAGMIEAMEARSPDRRDGAAVLAELKSAFASLQHAGRRTDLAAAVTGAIRRNVGQRLGAMVVVSDGQITVDDGRANLLPARQEAEDRPVSLLAVAVGDASAAEKYRNVTVRSLRPVTRQVRVGNRLEFTVRLANEGFGGQVVRLDLFRWRDDPRQATKVMDASVKLKEPASAGGRSAAAVMEQEEKLVVEPAVLGTEEGDFTYEVRAARLEGETDPDDNAASARLRVLPDQIHVLMIGRGSWEFQYLRNYLLRERKAGDDGSSREVFRVTVWQQDADKGFNQDASTGMRIQQIPRNLEELIGSPTRRPYPGYEVVILYDPIPGEAGFDAEFVKLLRQFVQVHGGGLCYIAGKLYTEHNLLDGKAYADLAAMLPVELARNTVDVAGRIADGVPKSYPVFLTPEGLTHPVMRMGGQAAAGGGWNILPGIYWSHPVQSVRPLGHVLAVSSNPFRRTASGQSEPVLVSGPAGAGQVFYVGFDGTWRWRTLEDATYYRLFWRDMVRFLGPTGIRQVVLSTPAARYVEGQPVTIEVEAYDDRYEPVGGETYEIIQVSPASSRPMKVTLRAVDSRNRPGVFTGQIEGLAPGEYEFAPAGVVAPERVERADFKVVPDNAEDLRTQADVETLRPPSGLVAQEDHFLTLDQAGRLADLIPPGKLTFTKENRRELLDSLPLATLAISLMVAMLATEWILRKRYNMT